MTRLRFARSKRRGRARGATALALIAAAQTLLARPGLAASAEPAAPGIDPGWVIAVLVLVVVASGAIASVLIKRSRRAVENDRDLYGQALDLDSDARMITAPDGSAAMTNQAWRRVVGGDKKIR